MAVIWGVSLSAIVFAVGSAYDYSKISTARNMSQDASDMLALTASAYMRDNDGVAPSGQDQGFIHGAKYYLSDYGIDLSPYSDSDGKDRRLKESSDPHFHVFYDTPSAGEVRVVITGKSKPAFMSMAGVDTLDFSSDSVVLYEATDLHDPASIFLVLDRSGSMSWTDDDSISRNAELRSTVKQFMQKLDQMTENVDCNVLRTAMYPYSSGFDNSNKVSPDWGTLTASEIDRLQASGGTNSKKGMEKARLDMRHEDGKHSAEHGNGNPLKFVILMTDGVNTRTHWDYSRSYPEPAHEHWYKYSRRSTTSHSSWKDTRYWGREWEPEGEWLNYAGTSKYDGETLTECTSMKNDGVKIYTIGYALGTDKNSDQEKIWESERAYAMLDSCATSSEYFFDAEDAEQLITAFESIGEDIIEKSIRIRT